VADDTIESIKTTKDAVAFLARVGADDDVDRCSASRKVSLCLLCSLLICYSPLCKALYPAAHVRSLLGRARAFFYCTERVCLFD
jgi:hypothetical protein